MPRERLVLGDQNVGVAVTVEIEKSQVRIAPLDVGEGWQGPKWLPLLISGALVESGQRLLENHAIELAVAGKVHELVVRCRCLGERWQRGEFGNRLEARRGCWLAADQGKRRGAEIALVVPGVVLLREHALQPLAVEVEPPIASAVDVRRQIGEVLGINLTNFILNRGLAVVEIDGGKRFLEVGSIRLPTIAGMCDTRDERTD